MSACQGGWGAVSSLRRGALGTARPTSCSNSLCLIRTDRDDEPESIQTSRVSFDLATGSVPFQSTGFTEAHNSAYDFSNQTFDPCFSTRSAVLRTIRAATFESLVGSGKGWLCAS